jgi:outer membrane receptor protein involved in Fe transport
LSVAICFAIAASAQAQEAAPPPADPNTPMLDTIEVTAQKRTENLQKVPISMQVLGEEQLDNLVVSDFEDYVKFLPTVSYQTFGPGFAQIYMRGVASGGDGNHSGSLPSVGVYLDEQPVTTIQGPLDIHIYDVARVESLAGPQGTLYGASAQAGALRIITNKPDPAGFAAGAGVEVNSTKGSFGHVLEGFINQPLGERAAIRLVGWQKHDAGYIDNREGDRQFPQRVASDNGTPDDDSDDTLPSWGGVLSNRDCTSTDLLVCTGAAKDDYNDVDTVGARLALRVNLTDSWTITPTIMGQRAESNGVFWYDPEVGDLAVTHFYPEKSSDRWWQAALTVEGKIGNFDITYAYAHLKRNDEVESDYNDYSFWYDTLYSYGAFIYDNDFNLINPSQYIQGRDQYRRDTHELRIASPSEHRLRFVGGLFWQSQFHDIEQAYKIDGLQDDLDTFGWPDTLWLTKQERRDHDEAVYGELSFDFIPDELTATIGARHFRARNSLQGYFGFSEVFYPGAGYGSQVCADIYGADHAAWPDFNGAPCEMFNKTVRESGTLGKFNVSWNITPTKMLYLTWSEGYRPGGINRRGTLPPYVSDFLTNKEIGWKTTWMENRLAFNGSVFRQEWEDFQFSILGANGLTEIKNANQAEIDGLEMSLDWAATYNLHVGAGVAFYDAQLTANYCGWTDEDGNSETICPAGTLNPNGTFDDPTDDFEVDGPEAPTGTQLPVTPRFKGNVTARYTWDYRDMEWFVQGSVVHVGDRTSDLRLYERELLGDLDAYNVADLSTGFTRDTWSMTFYVTNLFDERAEISKFTNCAESVCGAHDAVPEYPNGQVYTVTNQPRTFGVQFSKEF